METITNAELREKLINMIEEKTGPMYSIPYSEISTDDIVKLAWACIGDIEILMRILRIKVEG